MIAALSRPVSFGGPGRLPCMVAAEIRDGDATVATVRIDGAVPGLFVVDVVARLELAARRLGWSVRVTDPATCELLALAGLAEERRQPECREQPRVEEVVQLHEPPA